MQAIGLGVCNLVGLFVLGLLLHSNQEALEALADMQHGLGFVVVSAACWLYPVLLAYGLLYALIPAVRYLFVLQTNKNVALRNEKRKARAAELIKKALTAEEKLQFLKAFQKKQRALLDAQMKETPGSGEHNNNNNKLKTTTMNE